MAENRLFQMVYLLLEKRSMTAPELAKRFEVSVRTIYRDIDILSAAGIPVYTAQGKGGGIFIQENHVLDKSLISEQEQNQILLALQGIGILDDEHTKALLSKLGGIFQKQNTRWLEVDFSPWNSKIEEVFSVLQSAIFQSRSIRFTYSSGRGHTIRRNAEPLKLIFKSDEWYLYAYCLLREDFRLFKLVRIKELEMTEQEFIRKAPDKVLSDMDRYTGPPLPLTLLFDEELAYRVYENFDNITQRPDGKLLVQTDQPDHTSLYGFLLSFGEQLEVIAPSRVREKIAARIEDMRKKYKT